MCAVIGRRTITLRKIVTLNDIILGGIQRNRLLGSELLLLWFGCVGHGDCVEFNVG